MLTSTEVKEQEVKTYTNKHLIEVFAKLYEMSGRRADQPLTDFYYEIFDSIEVVKAEIIRRMESTERSDNNG